MKIDRVHAGQRQNIRRDNRQVGDAKRDRSVIGK